MNCQEIQNELSAYVDGELSPELRTQIDAHVGSCPQCRERFAELKKLAAGVSALPKLQPAPEFLTAVRRKIARGEEPGDASWVDLLFRASWPRVALGAAAVIAVLILLTDMSRPLWRRQPQMTMAKVEETGAKPADPAGSPEEGFRSSRNEPASEAPSFANDDRVAAEDEKSKSVLTDAAKVTGTDGFDHGGRLAGSIGGSEKSVNAIAAPAAIRPAETIVVESGNAAEVLKRAEAVARPLNGNLVRQTQTEKNLAKFYVELPTRNVEMFKKQLQMAEALGERRRDLATPPPVVAAPPSDADTNRPMDQEAVAQQKEIAPTTVLEIQVVPPKN